MSVVWTIAAAMLLLAAVLTTIAILRGPSTLDRLVSLDVLIALCMCGLGVWRRTASTRRSCRPSWRCRC